MALEWRVSSFERGRTDNYVNAERNYAQTYDNLIITRNRKPQTRPGSEIFEDASVATQQIPTGNVRIQHIKEHEGTLFEYTGGEIYYRVIVDPPDEATSTFPELVGPVDGFNAFGGVGSANTSHNSTAQWQNHLFSTIDTFARPRKIYQDEDGAWQIRTMGIPSPGDITGLDSAIVAANSLKTSYNSHVNDISPAGSDHNSADTNVTAADATDISTLYTLVNQIKDLFIAHSADSDLGSPVIHPGVAASDPLNRKLNTNDDVTTLTSAINMVIDLKAKYNTHNADNGAHSNFVIGHADSAEAATRDFTLTSENPAATSYIYGLNYKYTYKTNGKTFINRGPIHQVVITNGNDFTVPGNGIDISDIPELLNTGFGTQESWDTDSIVVEIYRTEANGIILKKVDEIANGVDTYEDDTTDADLGINAYTTGGAVNNDPPPLCKYLTQTNDVVWYANVEEEGQENPYRVRQSISNSPDSAPTSFFTDVDEPITGIGSVGIFPIVFTKDKTYRLEGVVDAQGRGLTRKRVVDKTVGCVSNNGIVAVKDGLYFPAVDGFYFTNGFKTTKITNHLNVSYKNITGDDTNSRRIHGAYDPINERVFWAVTSDPTSIENDQIWVLDPHWGIPNGQASFQTWSYGDNGKPTALEVIDGNLIRSDSRGYTFKHDDELFVDPVVNTTDNPEDWETKAVIYDYTSPAFTFGSEMRRKYVTRLLTVLKSLTNVSVQPQSINDDSGARRNLKELRLRTLFEWGDPFFCWGDPEFTWNAPATDASPRRFPRGGLRCTFKQVRYTNSYTIRSNSDQFGSVTVDSTLKTITIDAGVFSTDLVNFEIFFGASDIGHLITDRTDTVLTVLDPSSLLVDGVATNWVIKGFRKGEQFNLEGYTIMYDYYGTSHTAYNVGDDGGNAA